MVVVVAGWVVGFGGLIQVAMGVKVRLARWVAVDVKVHPLTHKAIDDLTAQSHQHDADAKLQPAGHTIGQRGAYDNRPARNRHQGQRMAQPPHRPCAHDGFDRCLARRHGTDGGDVVGLQGVAHAEQHGQDEERQHLKIP